ncbi:MAG: hypothetical protein M1825_003045 [Sarcosagium campestre]|nr:MAG: hypothetical protein M1825_003045 [Sarcosagium campestre]
MRYRPGICFICESFRSRPTSRLQPIARTFSRAQGLRSRSIRHEPPHVESKTPRSSNLAPLESIDRSVTAATSSSSLSSYWKTLGRRSSLLQTQYEALFQNTNVPPEDKVLEIARNIEESARAVTASVPIPSVPVKSGNAASSLLTLDDDGTRSVSRSVSTPQQNSSREEEVDALSNLSLQLVLHPLVFFSPALLKSYVTTQTLLRRPESLPKIFSLYKTKPYGVPNTKPQKYRHTNPSAAKNAIPAELADAALSAAIDAKDLPLALAIIETSFATPSFQRSKLVRKALLPGLGLSLAPAAAMVVASKLSLLQTTMDPSDATAIYFVGITAYIGFTAAIGFVALTTANDQMDRVSWATGLPLRERWIRKEERDAVDRVAVAWGFRDKARRGDEEGAEWLHLKDWIAQRGMILDRVELMEGMQ